MFIQKKMNYWISEFNENKLGKISKLGFYGVINNLGEIIVPIAYDKIMFYEKNIYAKTSNDIDAFDLKGNRIAKTFKSTRIDLVRSIYVHEVDRFIDVYDLSIYDEGLFPLGVYNEKAKKNKHHVAYADTLGNIIINNPKYIKGKFFSNGMAVVCDENEKCGFIDRKGKEIIPLMYDYCYPFKKKYAVVKLGEKFGIVNKKNKTIIPFKYENIINEYDAILAVKANHKYGFINLKNEVVLDFIYDQASSFHGGYSYVKKNGEFFYIDNNGVKSKDYQRGFEDGYRYMSYGADEYYENKLMDKIFKLNYDFGEGLRYRDGLSVVKLNNKYGFIDRLGNEVIPPIYDQAKHFKFGKGIVKLGNEWMLIDKSGKKIVSLGFNERRDILGFDDYGGFLEIGGQNGKQGVISSDGKFILPIKFDEITRRKKYIFVKLNKLNGVYDYKGNEILKPVFSKFYFKPNRFCIAHSENSLSIYDKNFLLIKKKTVDTIFPAPRELKAKNRYDLFYKSGNKTGYIDLVSLDFRTL
jgi:hypothetical protein